MPYIGWCVDIENDNVALRKAALAEYLAYIEQHLKKYWSPGQ